MKRSALIFFFYVMFNLTSYAQQDCTFESGKFRTNVEANLFGDKVNVREKPSVDAGTIVNLSIGTPVLLMSKAESVYDENGYSTNWYEVKIAYGGSEKTGYVWGGLISLGSAEIQNAPGKDDLFVYGITSWSADNGFMSTARIIREGKVINNLEFRPISMGFFDPGVFGHTVCVKADNGHGFSNIKNVIRISFSYAACGYENGEILLFWDGAKLQYAAKASALGEAGIFNYTYKIIFPDEPEGHENKLMIEQTMTEYGEVNDSIYTKSREVTLKNYKWDGVKIITLPEETK